MEFCINCKHLVPQDPQHPESFLDIARCGHPNFEKRSVNLVSGKEETHRPFAEHERASTEAGHCGTDATLFEAKGVSCPAS